MAVRDEITKKYVPAYVLAAKKGNPQILDRVVEITCWNRGHARQQSVARSSQLQTGLKLPSR